MKFSEMLKSARKQNGLTQVELAKKCHVSQGTVANWEAGTRTPDMETISMIATILNVTTDYLAGREKAESNISAVFEDGFRMIPVFESASAGFGALAENQVVDYVAFRIASETEAQETIAIRVQGDSMYPKIEDGDIIQVHKQDSIDSGSIAVILLDGDEGLVKKVYYGSDWIELQSINPNYPPMRFEGPEIMRVRVVGLVKGVLHEF